MPVTLSGASLRADEGGALAGAPRWIGERGEGKAGAVGDIVNHLVKYCAPGANVKGGSRAPQSH